MIIGVPKEIKNNEFRVSMTPVGVKVLINEGKEILVQNNAGLNNILVIVNTLKLEQKYQIILQAFINFYCRLCVMLKSRLLNVPGLIYLAKTEAGLRCYKWGRMIR